MLWPTRATRWLPVQQYLRAFVVFALLTLIYAGISVFQLWRDVSAYRLDHYLLSHGAHTTTVITGTFPHTYACGKTTCTNYYVYYYLPGPDRQHPYAAHFIFNQQPAVGDAILVYYLPGQPDVQVPASQVTTPKQIALHALILLSAGALAGIPTVWTWRLFRRARAAQKS